MMVEPNQSRGQWKVGWIVETFPKADGYSLNGESQTKDGNCIKPFHWLYRQGSSNEDEPTFTEEHQSSVVG